MTNKYKNKPQGEFASGLESFCFDILRASGINFEFQKTYVLQEGFKRNELHMQSVKLFNNVNSLTYAKGKKKGKQKSVLYQKNVLPIKMIVDFYIEGANFDVIIDTKGMKTADWQLKAKILEMQLSQKEKPTLLFIPSSQKEVKLVISDIKKQIIQEI